MTMKIIIAFMFFISISCFSRELEKSIISYGLAETKIPEGQKLQDANKKANEYCILEKSKKIIIKKARNYCKQDPQEVTINGYSFVGTDRGEFIGNLSVIYPGGSKRILIEDNVIQLIPVQDELFVFTGLSHMFTSRGAVHKVTVKDGKISSERLTLLPKEPNYVLLSNKKELLFFIVSYDGLFSFDVERESLRILLKDQFWGGLYPTSAIMKADQLAIGMRSGIALIDFGAKNRVEKIRYFSKKETGISE